MPASLLRETHRTAMADRLVSPLIRDDGFIQAFFQVRIDMKSNNQELNVALFFCQQLDPDHDGHQRVIEKEFGPRIKFFPLPCSGRIEPLHFLRAFEAGADLVYLIVCPLKVCRYQQGNLRAKKRIAYAQKLIQEIGLDPERLNLIITTTPLPKRIDLLTREILADVPVKGHSLLGKL